MFSNHFLNVFKRRSLKGIGQKYPRQKTCKNKQQFVYLCNRKNKFDSTKEH